MKKLLCVGAISAATIMPFSASADTVLGLYAGAQGWDKGVEGGFSQNENIAEFGFEDNTTSRLYAALEHPVPFVPNIKIARTVLDTTGGTLLQSTFTFGGEVYSQDTVLNTDIDLITNDYVLYYEVLDNDVVSFDIGLNAKHVDGEFFVIDEDSNESSRESFEGFVPMLYSRFAVGLPGTGLGAYAEGSFLSVDDSSVVDYQVAMTYSFIESLAVDVTLQLGYQSVTIDIEDIDDVYADMEFDGPFLGIEVHF